MRTSLGVSEKPPLAVKIVTPLPSSWVMKCLVSSGLLQIIRASFFIPKDLMEPPMTVVVM